MGVKMARYLVLWLYAIITLFALAFAQAPASGNKSTSSWLDLGLKPPSLQGRQIDSTCSNDRPCADGSCCHGRSGFCGRTPEHCAPGVCVSNCDAKADCGIGADTPGKTCPLNVCCGQWGYCGTTANFCGTGCQSNCPQPGPTMLSEGDVDELVIAYVEAWNFVDDAGCAKREANWIPVGQITHLNVAFYYIQPVTFAIDRMPGVPSSAYNQLVDLKEKAPGLKIWLAIGGWTFSDNQTVTQPLWNEIARTEGNRAKFIQGLIKFMSDQGYDGVDLDWEYPGAGDRGGKQEDVENFVHLVKDIRRAFDLQVTSTGHGWGLSFTAPTSYWYMRWFDLKGLVQAVDWVNLMTYDIHGSWDSPENQIGNIVLAHTNLTEIKDALNLFWRNDVPANKINLGIGFYGRTYKLIDGNCRTPGCYFETGGTPGPCTDTSGVLSYNEISAIRKEFNINPVYDREAGVKYMHYNRDQWLSYDDEETIKDKVDFASSQGLRGLFVWAIDQDDDDHTAISAIVPPGKFDKQNGVGTNGNFKPATGSCTWSSCGDSPKCAKSGTVANGHDIKCKKGGRKVLCCPLDAQPDPKSCRWEVGEFDSFFDVLLGICGDPDCHDNEVLIATSDQHYWENGGDKACNFGSAEPKYCCQGKRGGKDVCAPTGKCTNILLMEHDPSLACPQGRKLVTTSAGKCGAQTTPRQSVMPWCCEEEVITKNCFWTPQGNNKLDTGDSCNKLRSCPPNYVEIGEDTVAAASSFSQIPDCLPPGPCIDIFDDLLDIIFWPDSCEPTWGRAVPRKLCCPANDLNIGLDFLPVPLEYLFDYEGQQPPDDAITTYQIDIDASGSAADDARDANSNAFGWHIISGPPGEVTSFDRRDDSHWVLLDCNKDMHEDHTHTIKAVCTDESDGSNCDDIFRDGVATTVVKMPSGCGPGKYAIAVSLEPAKDYDGVPKNLIKHLEKRGIPKPRVYEFTFNYDYSPIIKRGDSNKRIRIDYSDDAGYWANIVSAPPGRPIGSRSERLAWKREQQEEVDRDHKGSWERYLDHKWSLDRRSTPEDKLHELHERWFSSTLGDWLNAMQHVDENYEIFKRSIGDTVTWTIFEWAKTCQLGGFPTQMYLKMWAEINYDVEAVAMLNLIGDFGDLNSWKESHVHFRTRGDVEASLNFLAFAKISFNSDEIELFGMERFGATFGIPGLVTIGPNFKIMARLDGEASLHTEAKISMNVASWDYTQQYPNQDSSRQDDPAENSKAKAKQLSDGPAGSGFDAPKFHADIEIKGRLTLTLTPKVLFGIQWKVDVPDVSVEVGIKSFATIHASAGATIDTGDQSAQLRACWGIDCGYTLYASVNAPTIFGHPLSQYWPLASDTIPIVDQCVEVEVWDGKNDCDNCPDIRDNGIDPTSSTSNARKRFRRELSALEGISPVNFVEAYSGPV
ncbi:family 18 glycosyl hydrolase [Lasiosphaeria hispida]|uniref:chitinase n=1 Tax=Lasiosphaeria hispida TaxID=260671 RepID=A0AAJ0HSN8_9PEZI|nr:family 18 glycosyl hydrolase [Lasiosphaeria hispida]